MTDFTHVFKIDKNVCPYNGFYCIFELFRRAKIIFTTKEYEVDTL